MVELLQENHELDNTVIVITGDHGIRTAQEDPSFRGGIIDEYSFHVPLLIYAPRALQHTVKIPGITSHIDVAPTVLNLLGLQTKEDFAQGSPIWDPEIAKRRTYFFANTVFGADGYFSGGRFYMYSQISDSVYENSSQHFDTPVRFFETMGGLMEAATKAAGTTNPRIAFCGEGLGVLWRGQS